MVEIYQDDEIIEIDTSKIQNVVSQATTIAIYLQNNKFIFLFKRADVIEQLMKHGIM